MGKTRLDIFLAEHGLAESRSAAQRLVMAGSVRVNDQVVYKPADSIDVHDKVTIDNPPMFVSRGGEKLLGALKEFNLLNLAGLTCVDVGASTGGFTDCLLHHGAKKVYAVDVGHGILHWKLRQDPRVVVMEKTNARFIKGFPEEINLVTIDASFISLRTLLPNIKSWLTDSKSMVIALIKPQFEAGRQDAAKGEGVIRDTSIHKRILTEIIGFATKTEFQVGGLVRSPLIGPKGNIEFLILLQNERGDGGMLMDWVEGVFPALGEVPLP